MQRRNFLKTLCTIPTVTLLPTLSQADDLSQTNDLSTTGLDRIVDIIKNDKRLNKRVSQEEIDIAISSAIQMNRIIIEAIIQTGVGNDQKISTADTREINDYIYHNYHDVWIELHGDDEDDSETGFHLVVNDGAKTKIFGHNAINRVFDSIYHLGFETHLKNHLLNEDDNKNASFKHVAQWLDRLLKTELKAQKLTNPDIQEVTATTDTGLDKVIDIIYHDKGLQKHISTGDMRIGATSANTLNTMLLEAIDATNAGISGNFSKDDMKNINQYLITNYKEEWAIAHGKDTNDSETGYHKVKNDGAKTKLFNRNAINRVFDCIYHLGFETPYKNRLVDENGDKSTSFRRASEWLNSLLEDDLNNQKEDLKILIPLYSYPNWYSDEYTWQKLIDTKTQNPNIEIVAIVNPSNGHFSEENSDFVHGIKDLIDANIKVVGYVYTQYGNRDTQEVIADIDAWQEFYKDDGVSGIFFDEVSTDSNLLEHYTNLSTEAKTRGFDFVILNPGITTDQSYIDANIADIIVSYESPYEQLIENPPSNYNTPSQNTELSLLIYKMEDDNIDDLISFAREHQFGYIYFTEDGFDNNPWDSISQYFEEEVQKALT